MKRLRSGYTTGACAAAAAKGAALTALTGEPVSRIAIPFPDGRNIDFDLAGCRPVDGTWRSAVCSVIKDAGDDPDVTNGAEIVAEVVIVEANAGDAGAIIITGGPGIGIGHQAGSRPPDRQPCHQSGPSCHDQESGRRGLRCIGAKDREI